MTTTARPAAPDTTREPEVVDGQIPKQSSTPRAGRSRAYTNWVLQVCREDVGARSALRSGLGKDLDSVRRMHRLVAPWLPEQCSADVERAYYTVAAMIAAQPRSALAFPDLTPTAGQVPPDGQEAAPTRWRRRASLGTAFAVAVTEGPGREKEMRAGTAESRLNLLTRQSVNGLHRHLPASAGYLRTLGVDVDWSQLLDDLGDWRRHSGRISRTWLQDFYRLRDQKSVGEADDADEEEELAAGPTGLASP
ncbi:type I-E CRISPR-associated protein Cse2/CasB [Streptomyces sp. NPDC002309]